MKILILGVNGFIGHHLTNRILDETDWSVYGMDLAFDRLDRALSNPRFHFLEGDISINKEWIEYHIKKCDVVMPLVAIATPKLYVEDPIGVFNLDFEMNLNIVKQCVKYKKRIVFPSTSEVYGDSRDPEFKEDETFLVVGPIQKERWIYACCKQLLDRVIYAYGTRGYLEFTLFRPFNWIGPRLDSLDTAKEGSSRVVTQFIAELMMKRPISLVDGGHQKRCFTYVDDGIDALMAILEIGVNAVVTRSLISAIPKMSVRYGTLRISCSASSWNTPVIATTRIFPRLSDGKRSNITAKGIRIFTRAGPASQRHNVSWDGRRKSG